MLKKYIYIFLISMVPIIELRGAVPVSQVMGLPIVPSFIVCNIAKAGRGLFVALLLFVGIPLPGTGAWTGTLAASILDMDFKSTVAAVMLGVLLAGMIMMIVSLAGVSIFL